LGEQYYQPSFTVRLTQPLLKNAEGIQDSLDINLKQLNLKLANLSSEENLESYITQLARLYLDWYLAAREMAISKEVHQQAIEQEKLTRIKVKRQVIEPYELLRAQETREDYYSRWLQSQGRYLGLTSQIWRQMNPKQYVISDKLTPVNPASSQLFTIHQSASESENYLANTSRLKNILIALQGQQQLILDAKGNAKKADLNLSLGYTRHGVDNSFSDAHSSNLKQNDYSVMLEYRYALGNKRASGDYQAQLASKHQIEADTQQRMIDAEANLANLQEQETQLIVALKSIDRKISLATKKLSKEQRLYKIGKLDLFELLRDQTAHLESRLQKEQLSTRLLTLQLNIGELLDNNLAIFTSTPIATPGK
jgi:outer membrane protein TolC